jgi:hypothetical protein
MTTEELYRAHNLPPRRSHSRVLLEYGDVRQVKGESFRRWFRSRRMDLTVWYSADGAIEGFQLCYGCDHDERALTWHCARGYAHDQVDQGDPPPGKIKMKMTPVLEPDGPFDSRDALAHFRAECSELPHEIVEFVTSKLEDYRPPENSEDTRAR